MTIDTAKLRELAQAVLDTQGADHACLAHHQHMTGMHPADVLAQLDENARLREAMFTKGCWHPADDFPSTPEFKP